MTNEKIDALAMCIIEAKVRTEFTLRDIDQGATLNNQRRLLEAVEALTEALELLI